MDFFNPNPDAGPAYSDADPQTQISDLLLKHTFIIKKRVDIFIFSRPKKNDLLYAFEHSVYKTLGKSYFSVKKFHNHYSVTCLFHFLCERYRTAAVPQGFSIR